MQKVLFKLMYFARRYLFHTWLGRTRFAVWVYARVFDSVAPDLTKPIVFRGVPLYLDPSDKACVPSIVAGYFERKELDVFEELAQHATVFYDVGANFGLYSVLACAKADQLVAYAFEPIKENQRLLVKNIDMSGLADRVFPQPVAVSDERGQATMHLDDPTTHSLEYHPGRPTRIVETITLDGFTAEIGRGPDLMKVDVEGHESSVLAGAWEMLDRYTPTLLLEFIPRVQEDVVGLIDRLARLFETCFVVDEIAGTVVERDIQALHNQRGCNLILTRRPGHAAVVRRFTADVSVGLGASMKS